MAAAAPPQPPPGGGAAAARLLLNRAPPSAALLPFPGNVNVNYSMSNNNSWKNKKKYNNNIVKCKSYRKLQMDTPGAYQLVDDQTGDKYIVWGGDDDDVDVKNDTVSSSSSSSTAITSNTLPSKQLLTWKPPKTTPTTAAATTATATATTNTQQESTQALAPSFGKLKAQKINNLVRRITQKKHQTKNLDNDDNNHQDRPPSSYKSEADLSDQSRPRRDVMQRRKAIADSEYTLRDVSVSRPSHSSSRGWGDGRIRHYYASKTDDDSERWRQLNDKSNFFSRKTFQDLGCTEYVIDSLRAQNYPRPSHIQAMAFGPVIGGKSCIIADQSGSGKTLSYLLPLVQRLREEELQGLNKSLPESPRVVILVPTAELASQVLSVCRSLSKSGVPFRSMVTTGGFRQKTQLESLRQELDVLIATPGRFLYLVKEGFLQLTNLKSAVLDEVDILYNDEDFELALDCLVNTSPVTTQYIFVTATLPLIIYKKLVEAFPDSDVIMGPGVHRTSPGLEEILVDCSGDDSTEKTPETAFINKKNALQKLVEGSPVTRTIIFCHKIETCRKVENMLKRFDRKESTTRVLPFHAALDQRTRVANINEFRSSQSQNTSLFLVCTDRASRGIDFAGVDHVVLFDFPRDPSEYVRRVGRTARGAGGIGKAFIFVVGKQVSLAQRIIERNSKGHPLHDVPTEFD